MFFESPWSIHCRCLQWRLLEMSKILVYFIWLFPSVTEIEVLFAFQAGKSWVRTCMNCCRMGFLVSCQGISRHQMIGKLFLSLCVGSGWLSFGVSNILASSSKDSFKAWNQSPLPIGVRWLGLLLRSQFPEGWCEALIWEGHTCPAGQMRGTVDWHVLVTFKISEHQYILRNFGHILPQVVERVCAFYFVLRVSGTSPGDYSHFTYWKTEASVTQSSKWQSYQQS